jgi:hypothetical protein
VRAGSSGSQRSALLKRDTSYLSESCLRRDGRGGSEEEMGREDGTVESDGGNITRTPDTSGR